MNQRLSAVVVGTGFIGPVHVEGLRRAGVRVAGVVGSTPEKSREAAARLDLPKGYASLEDALEDAAVDAVHLTTPNRCHFAQASAALRAGKHVLCEKPLAMNSRETRELVRLAAETGRAAGVCYNIRYYPLCIEAADRVRGGEVGDLLHVAGSYAQDWLLHPTDFNWRVLAELGGELRAVADIGTHWLDLVQFIAGRKVEALCADLQTVHPERRRPRGDIETFSGKTATAAETEPVSVTTDDYGCLLLRFRGGGRGVVWVSQTMAGRKNSLRFELAGSKRSLAWASERPDELWIGSRDIANQTLVRDPALLGTAARRHTDYPGEHSEGFADTFKQLFRSFYGYIEQGDFQAPCPFPTFGDGHRELVLCEATLKSHRERRWVEIEEDEA